MSNSTSVPGNVWLFHPPSGSLQEVAETSWADIQAQTQADPNVEGYWHRWVLATPEQAALGEQIKAERLAADTAQTPPAPEPTARRRA